MNTSTRPGRATFDSPASAMVGRMAKVKALDPLTSTSPPTLGQVTEYSDKGLMLRVKRQMTVGTVVQVYLEGSFALWKVFCCVPVCGSYHLGLEFAEAVPIVE